MEQALAIFFYVFFSVIFEQIQQNYKVEVL